MGKETRSLKMPAGFLRMKFVPPALPQPFVREVAASERVFDLRSWRVCLVSAAPGFGKTTLLAQWYSEFEESGCACPLWVSLDARDCDPVRFAASLAISFQRVDQRFYALAERLCLDGDCDFETGLVDLVNLIDETCSDGPTCLLLLDDYELASSERVDDAVSFLRRYTPDGLRVVVAGSYLSPRMEDLLVDTSVIELRTSDIAPSGERLRSLAFTLMPDLSEGEFEKLNAVSGGWPASFAFYRLARRHAGSFDEAAALMEGYYARFFDRTIFSKVDAETYEFLVETSLLEDMEGGLCLAMTGNVRSQAVIDQLRDRNMFIVSGCYPGAYRYHPVFRSYLRSKLLSLRQSQIARLARKASTWCLERGRIAEALKYLAMACDPYFLKASAEVSSRCLAPDECGAFLSYLMEMPAESIYSDPLFSWIAVWATVSAGRVDLTRSTMGGMLDSGLVKGDEPACRYVGALCASLEGRTEEALSAIDELIFGDKELPSTLVCLLVHMQGECLERLGNLHDSQMTYQKSLSLAERESTAFYRLFDLYLLARQCLDLGNVDDAVRYASRALDECQEGSSLYGELSAVMAQTFLFRNQLDKAKMFIDRALRRVSLDSNLDMFVDVQVTYARYLQATGNIVSAIEVADRVIKSTRGKSVPRNLDVEAYAAKTSMAALSGDIASAATCEYRLDEFSESPDVLRAVPCIEAKAALELARGESASARKLYQRARRRAQECGSTRFLTEIGVAMACLESSAGRMDQAMAELGKAVELAMATDNVSAFVKGNRRVRDLLISLATNRKASSSVRAFCKRVLVFLGGESRMRSDVEAAEGGTLGYFSLTDREREVLKYLNSGMSRAEIADAMSVSQNTVKSHLKNVYAKLGVHSRAEAYKASPELEAKSE